MELTNWITLLGSFVGLMISIITFCVTYRQLANFKGEKAKELHGRYKIIKDLAVDLEKNYAEILIILSGLTNANLTIDEIHWFLTEPRAFLKLNTYGNVCGRYCLIDLKNGQFTLNDRVLTRKLRIIERCKVISLSFGLLAFLTSVWLTIILTVDSITTINIAVACWVIYFILILWGTNLVLTTLSKAVKLQGKP
ncbi:hypothetical protein PVK64_19995 [Aliivibrio sp. S4TY2]|uniref:hypothetical protein n=1 Tax=unclassified Aliivibrio TaxID=2645654 RepID=UPI002378649A|nr:MULTISPECIES: hypothetical protein [unclassified Aliivibrio]MDD9158448.1 hypothetical protein [Aliivibrio sp. S4TY2]MDD9162454.1 hypothetical protein [Aliivibrio sp. S4TY1]MDD9166455.1 hypothetical protein [Aliivibrio sp. S4MY2]MDD9170453.1 hypothetical protein [Aliivibrio sp. S4MY4]MDD9187534.1 hypothetical protein [Aliivibrio sp. S4MY3]